MASPISGGLPASWAALTGLQNLWLQNAQINGAACVRCQWHVCLVVCSMVRLALVSVACMWARSGDEGWGGKLGAHGGCVVLQEARHG